MHKINRGRLRAGPGPEAAVELALDEARERYRSLFQHNPHAVYSFDLEGRFLSANPACERLTGHTEAELLQLTFHQLIAPEAMARTIAAFGQAAAGEPQHYESTHLHKDGHQVDIAVTNMPIIVAGSVVGVYGVAEDISERRRAEEALREGEAYYRKILEEIAEGYFETDLAGNLTFANDALCALFGCSRDEMLALTHKDFSGPREAAKVSGHFRRVLASGVPEPGFEWTMTRRGGEQRVVSTSASLIHAPDGTPAGFRGITRDVTERNLAQEALRRSEERYRLAMRATQEVIWDSDLQAGKTILHGAVRAMFGIAHQTFDHAGAWLESRIHPEDKDSLLESIDWLFGSDGEMWSREFRVRRQDGSYMDVFARGHVVRGPDGEALRFVGSMMDISAQKRSEAELERLAFIDPLTGLANRSRLLAQLDDALAKAHSSGSAVAVFFLDLDRFKLINDGMGHAAGDSLLAQFGARLTAVIRTQDVASRFAGDEFVVVCSDTDEENARKIADRIASAVQEPFTIQGNELFVSVSIGIVLSEPGDTADSLLHRSDAAMYHSKADGKGAAFLFDEKMQHQALEVINIESQLSRAIERNELELYYQPVLDLEDFRPIGLEALVRWNRPGVGMVTAGEFIPIAEKSGLILRIGAWVLQEALQQARIWRQSLPGAEDLAIGVNISARQLQDPSIFDEVQKAIAAVGIQPDAVVLEITESELVGDLDGSVQVLERLRKLGVGIAVDDFGTGYSALSYLSRIPANVIKIDRSFIRPLGREGAARARALVAAIISMAAALDLVVVVEGVETDGQAAEVAGLNARLGQGYHWCRPLPGTAIEEWLRTQYAWVAAERAQGRDCLRFASAPVQDRR
ncbi:EAL domain-containing protein [Pseudarthrobacter sp. NPDC058362]|uniref:sensor domain-containing protein n=1 Tax=Pseudarthrobacter sp. NPDC058362 TaxID=3346458 RepID=UPI00365B4395